MKDIIKTNIRALKWINSISKWYMTLMALVRLFNNVTPFVNITMSALVLNEIAGQRRVSTFVHLVALTLIINMCIGTISVFLSRLEKLAREKFWLGDSKARVNRFQNSDFEQLEDGTVLEYSYGIYQASQVNGFGILAMIETAGKFIDNIVNIVLSVGLMTSMIVVILANPGEARGIWFVAALFAMIIAFIFVSLRNSKILATLGQEIATENRRNTFHAEIFGESFQENAYQRGKDFRIYNMNQLIDSFKTKRLESLRRNNKKYWRGHKNARLPEVLLSHGLNFVIYAFVAINALSGLFGIGAVVMYVGYIQRFITAVKDMATNISMLRMNQPFIINYLDYLEIVETTRLGTRKVDKQRYEIEFHNVSYKYAGADGYAVKNLSLKLENGKRLAIVGMNGSGKTTMIKLLCRLYDPSAGKITLNGVNIRDYNFAEYIGLFSVVFQDFGLFSFTLGENVTAVSEYDSDRVAECLKMTGFEDRLHTMPNGLDTALYKSFDENGVEISGGEAQKVALARALYKDAPFVVLDEPTSALDPIAEFEIYKRFNDIVQDKTAIYISHRLSSCRFCDGIIVFHEGEMVEFGRHETLLADANGKYSELWNAQVQYYVAYTYSS